MKKLCPVSSFLRVPMNEIAILVTALVYPSCERLIERRSIVFGNLPCFHSCRFGISATSTTWLFERCCGEISCLCFSRGYAFGREMVCSQKSFRNRNFFENTGHVSFSFRQTGSTETHTKPRKTSPQGTSIKRPAIYWDHAVSWGGGVWVSVSDIGRVGKK